MANSKHETPTSTMQFDWSNNSILLKDFFVEITAPLTPASLTKIFVPFPNQVIMQSFDFKKSERSFRSFGVKKISAGPPTFQEVCLDKGSLRTILFPIIIFIMWYIDTH